MTNPLLKTKPNWFPTAIATDRGWENPKTGEVLVAIGRLKTLLGPDAEVKAPATTAPKKTKAPKEKKVIAEVVEQPKDIAVIGEVVETVLDNQVIGE